MGCKGGEGFLGGICCLGGKNGSKNRLQNGSHHRQILRTARKSAVFATKYLPYLPTEEELVAEIEWEKLGIREWFGGVGLVGISVTSLNGMS